MNSQSSSSALQPGYELHWYRIEQVLGKGAFGITYLAHDVNLDRQVAIKEYLPGQFSVRNSDLTVVPTSDEHREDFEWGLKRFISEARTLTRFEHHNLVRVFNVFEMNNTAYMVMNYEVGKSLQQVLKSRKTLSEPEITKILLPLMDGLEVMHEQGFVHRDIKPGNIFIRGDGSPVLLDFGSARQTRVPATREGEEDQQTLTTLVSPGYAPIEQYGSKRDRQGPWTDIYGMGATLYRAITGTMPVAAVDRGEAIVHDSKDPYLPLKEVYNDRYSVDFLAAIDHALAFKAQDRPQNIAEWRKEFGSDDVVTATGARPAAQSNDDEAETVKLDEAAAETVKLPEQDNEKTAKIDSEAETVSLTSEAETVSRSALERAPRGGRKWLLITGAVAVIAVVVVISFMGGNGEEPAEQITKAETTDWQFPEPVTTDTPATAEMQSEEPGMEQPATTAAIDGTETPVESQADSDAVADQVRISELLAKAREDIEALRLTSPKDDNAFDKYLAVLALDENNASAKLGIQEISDKYVALAYGAMESNKLDHADSYLRKASAITPDSQKIAMARDALREKQATTKTAGPERQQATQTTKTAGTSTSTTTSSSPEAENASFWDKVQQWHDKQMEESKKNPPKENPLDNRVKDAFGN